MEERMEKKLNLGDFVLDTDKNEYGMIVPDVDNLESYKLYRAVKRNDSLFYKPCSFRNVKKISLSNEKLFGIYENLYQNYSCKYLIKLESEIGSEQFKDYNEKSKILSNNKWNYQAVFNQNLYNSLINKGTISSLKDIYPGKAYLACSINNNVSDYEVILYLGKVKIASNDLYYKVSSQELANLYNIYKKDYESFAEKQKVMDDYFRKQKLYSGDICGNLFATISYDQYLRYNNSLKNISKILDNPSCILKICDIDDLSNYQLFDIGAVRVPKTGTIPAYSSITCGEFRFVLNYFDTNNPKKKVKYELVK